MKTMLAMIVLTVAARATETARVVKPTDAGVGRFVPDCAFAGGKLSDFNGDFLVIALTNDTCPLCRKYVPTWQALEKEFASKKVAFLFVNPTDAKSESPFQGNYINDAKLAAHLGAVTTTDVFVLDAKRTVVYRGAVDDQYGIGYSTDAPKHEYLKSALNALLDGKTPEVRATTAPGCKLDIEAKKAQTEITYHNRISRIVQQNCLECHRAGGVGPFSLESVDHVIKHRGAIAQVLDAGTMPPWFASKEHGPFKNDRSLSDADKADFLKWLASDRPVGSEADAPKPRVFKSVWNIGEPDAVVQLPRAVPIKATGTMPYQILEVETKFDEDKWVKAVEVQPGAREVVHHVIVSVHPKGAKKFAGLEERQGYFAAYVPGNSFTVLPEGQARLLAKGSVLRFQMHYTPNGQATTDQTKLGLVFTKEPPKVESKVAGIADPRISIPPGDDNHKEVAKIRVPSDSTIYALMPHMHVRGKACKYELTTPDGKTRTLLDVPHYDFNWQLRYQFAEPVAAPKGSTLTFTVWYDNSDRNPANPDAKKTVKWGPQTSDEMMLGYLEYTVDRKEKPAASSNNDVVIPEALKEFFKTYDKNGDGKLSEAEIEAMPQRLKDRVREYAKRQ